MGKGVNIRILFSGDQASDGVEDMAAILVYLQ